jgi:nucleoside-diphosphate kinase
MNEYCFVIVKPGGVRRGHVGDIISHLEEEGFELLALKHLTLSRRQATSHYRQWQQEPWFRGLLAHMISGPSVAVAVRGDEQKLARLVGTTDPAQSAPDTLRALYGVTITDNAVHTSSPGEGERELRRFFPIHQRYALGFNAWWRRSA